MRCSSRLLLLSDALLPVEIFLSADLGKLDTDSGPESKLLPDFRLERSELWLKLFISLAVPKKNKEMGNLSHLAPFKPCSN
jgi:hypothetical protein